MAKANPVDLQPQPPEVPKTGPVIDYLGDETKARAVKFELNPKAVRYVVNANGQVSEYL